MTAIDRRLKQVEAALYPTEALARWLQQARQDYQSLAELAADLSESGCRS